MIRTDSILKALDIDADRYPVLSVVGGGGKTSLIFRMMEELTAAGKKVIITTTTHMAYDPERPFAEDGDMISIKQNLEECGYTIAASLDREKRKIGALSEEKLKEIKVLADVMLIEADGAKRYPLKVPAGWEPVIWEQTDLVIAVAGIDAVGRPIREVCHRPENVADFLGKETEKKLTEEDIVRIVLSTEALRKCVDGALGTKEAVTIVPKVEERIRNFKGTVLFTRDTHESWYLDTQEGKKLPVPHCIRNTEGWQIRNELDSLRKTEPIDKETFGSTDLAAELVAMNIDDEIGSITFVGLCTDICVISNALLVKAALPEVPIIVDAACCAGVTPESHENALNAMKMCQIDIVR